MSVTAPITNISRGSLHDGNGVRSVVYFKGCGLRCAWCHNPENLLPHRIVLYAEIKCIRCGRCITACPEHHVVVNDRMTYLREGCMVCGRCANACPSGALSLCGKEMTVDEVLCEVLKDRHYYLETGGGVTLSGGECLLYPDFCAELLSRLQTEGISTAIESALYVHWENVARVSPFADVIFADLKLPDSARHKKYTGQSNERIINNIRMLSNCHKNIMIRIPLIPNVNDSESDMAAFASVLSSFGDGIKAVELLKYNYLAESKYSLVGSVYQSFGNKTQTNEALAVLADTLARSLDGKANVMFRQ